MKTNDFINFLNTENIDCFLEESPVDKTVVKEAPVKTTSIIKDKAPVKKPKAIDLTSVDNLEDLEKAINSFEHKLQQTALNMVFSRGNSEAPKVMFIGEAPGQEEDLKGLPFVGKAGQLLDKMIAAIKLTEKDFYLTNVVNYRPENNRTPTDEEIADFLPFLKKHIELVKPQVICILGDVALKALLPDVKGISKNHGELQEFNGIPTIATFHPAYLLRFPNKKKDAWEDLQKLQEKI